MIEQLFKRVGTDKGYDLCRTFATLATVASGDECLAMRLFRDRVPGSSNCYISYGSVTCYV
jgi:hypothetical protein